MDSKVNQSIIGGIIAFILATSCCWLPAVAIALGGASGLMAFSEGLEKFSGILMAAGSVFLLFGVYQYYKMKEAKKVKLESSITCPDCGFSKTETMPTDACQFFYKCENCNSMLKPKPGDCCVYCSYGKVPCPPVQEGNCEC